MLLGSFNPEKNIAYLDYKELNPTNKEKHDEIFKQMKVHYANYLDALEGSKNKNLDQSIRNQLNIQALSEEGKYKQQMNLITDLMAPFLIASLTDSLLYLLIISTPLMQYYCY